MINGGSVLGNVIKYNKGYGVNAPFDTVGAANNTLFLNGDLQAESPQQTVNVQAMQPNFCTPECNYVEPQPEP